MEQSQISESIMISQELNEIRCPECGALLFCSEKKDCIVEIKCRRCGKNKKPITLNLANNKN